jgi:hypothetical protein
MAKHTLPWQMQILNAFLQKSIKDRKQNILTFKPFSKYDNFR